MKDGKLKEIFLRAENIRTIFKNGSTQYGADSSMNTSYGLNAMSKIMGVVVELVKNQQEMQDEIDALKERIQELEAPKTVQLAKPAFRPSRE
jgi:hypothetical protein